MSYLSDPLSVLVAQLDVALACCVTLVHIAELRLLGEMPRYLVVYYCNISFPKGVREWSARMTCENGVRECVARMDCENDARERSARMTCENGLRKWSMCNNGL